MKKFQIAAAVCVVALVLGGLFYVAINTPQVSPQFLPTQSSTN